MELENKNYKLLIFDADETLFDFKMSEKEALRKSIEQIGIKYSEEIHLTKYSLVNHKIWKEFELGQITQKKLKVERFKRFFDLMGISFDAGEFALIFMDYLSKESHLLDGAYKLVESLSKKYELMIITNGLTSVQKIRIRKSLISHFFNKIVISEEIGVSKPSKEIFELALIGYDYKKSEMLMLGDNLTSDILGGINYGIDTVWYNPNEKTNTTDVLATFEINDLIQLKELL